MNSRGSPERVVICNPFDQTDLLLWNLRSAICRSAFPFPIQCKALLMPSDNSFWLDDQQCTFPGDEDIRQDAEKEPIGMS